MKHEVYNMTILIQKEQQHWGELHTAVIIKMSHKKKKYI